MAKALEEAGSHWANSGDLGSRFNMNRPTIEVRMGLFGAIVKTAVNTAMLPVAAVKDAATLGGATTGKGSYVVAQLDTLKREAE